MAIDWTPERTNALIALWNEGLSTAEIGRRLGVTKNAVVGKVHRLGLPKRQSPISVKPAPKPKRDVKKNSVRMEALRPGMCCWPEGEPGTDDFHFCGQQSIPGKPYCEEHCVRAYVKSSKDSRSKAA